MNRPFVEVLSTIPRSRQESVRNAMDELHNAFDYANLTGREVWDFAISLSRLERIGLVENDVRLLLYLGVLKHNEEVSSSPNSRQFRRADPKLMFAKNSCFVLSESARALTTPSISETSIEANKQGKIGPKAAFRKPCWDAEHRELTFDFRVVKRFKWVAVNQEAVLSAFQEEAWPVRIFDPLPPSPEIDSKRRLHDTIKCLNQRHQFDRIRFHGDGTGEGVTWQALAEPKT